MPTSLWNIVIRSCSKFRYTIQTINLFALSNLGRVHYITSHIWLFHTPKLRVPILDQTFERIRLQQLTSWYVDFNNIPICRFLICWFQLTSWNRDSRFPIPRFATSDEHRFSISFDCQFPIVPISRSGFYKSDHLFAYLLWLSDSRFYRIVDFLNFWFRSLNREIVLWNCIILLLHLCTFFFASAHSYFPFLFA